MREAEIQAQVREFLQWRGWYIVKIHQSLGSHKGIADLYALKNGRHLWLEIKTPKGRLSEHQVKFRDAIITSGGEYRVARCVQDVSDL